MVDIYIERLKYTDKSIISTLIAKGTKTSLVFKGYALENIKAGQHHDKLPIPAGVYPAKVRTDGPLGWRIELFKVPGHHYIEIHVGNYPKNSHGCFLAGKTWTTNAVWHSRAALKEIHKIIADDDDNAIAVHVKGSNIKQ